MQDLVVVGAGGHAREVVSLVRDLNQISPSFRLLGLMADECPDEGSLERLSVEYLGPVPEGRPFESSFVVAIGAPDTRRLIAEHIAGLGGTAATLVHPTASVGSDVVLAEGTVVFAGSVLTTNVRVGRHSHLNVNCSVSHDCRLGEYSTVSPGAVVCGNVRIGEGAYIGAGACIIQGIDIGVGAVVGAGSVVTRNVNAGATVAGVPARAMGSDSPR